MYQHYRQTEADNILNASPERLVTLLLEEALLQIRRAREYYESNQRVRWQEAVTRVMRIVDCLSASLDLEKGGEIASNLERLYDFATDQLYAAVRAEDPTPYLPGVEKVISNIHSGWTQAAAGR